MTDSKADLAARLQQRIDAEAPDRRGRSEELMRRARERWEQAQKAQDSMRQIRATAVSPRREVSVTAVWGGGVSDIEFPTSAYKRMPAKELAALLRTTVAEAQRKVTEATADLLAPTLPEGVDAVALLSGDVDVTRMFPSGRSPFADGLTRTLTSAESGAERG